MRKMLEKLLCFTYFKKQTNKQKNPNWFVLQFQRPLLWNQKAEQKFWRSHPMNISNVLQLTIIRRFFIVFSQSFFSFLQTALN